MVLETPLLVIDDLVAEKVTDWSRAVLFSVLNDRINNKMPTIVTSNLTPAEISEVLGERIGSRLAGDFLQVEIKGEDRRIGR